jgi:hypothetical protein
MVRICINSLAENLQLYALMLERTILTNIYPRLVCVVLFRSKGGITSAISLNTTAAGVLPQWQSSGRLISILMCEHKNIKMSNLWQPFTNARRWHVANVFD